MMKKLSLFIWLMTSVFAFTGNSIGNELVFGTHWRDSRSESFKTQIEISDTQFQGEGFKRDQLFQIYADSTVRAELSRYGGFLRLNLHDEVKVLEHRSYNRPPGNFWRNPPSRLQSDSTSVKIKGGNWGITTYEGRDHKSVYVFRLTTFPSDMPSGVEFSATLTIDTINTVYHSHPLKIVKKLRPELYWTAVSGEDSVNIRRHRSDYNPRTDKIDKSFGNRDTIFVGEIDMLKLRLNVKNARDITKFTFELEKPNWSYLDFNLRSVDGKLIDLTYQTLWPSVWQEMGFIKYSHRVIDTAPSTERVQSRSPSITVNGGFPVFSQDGVIGDVTFLLDKRKFIGTQRIYDINVKLALTDCLDCHPNTNYIAYRPLILRLIDKPEPEEVVYVSYDLNGDGCVGLQDLIRAGSRNVKIDRDQFLEQLRESPCRG